MGILSSHAARRATSALSVALVAATGSLVALAPLHASAGGGQNTSTLTAVAFAGPTSGWAVGGDRANNEFILHTSDNSTWSPQTPPPGVGQLTGVAFPTTTVGFAVADDQHNVPSRAQVIATNDGGATWSAQSIPTTSALDAVAFTSSTSGWAVGANFAQSPPYTSGAILHTANGTTWTAQSVSAPGDRFYGVAFAGPMNGWAVGDGPNGAVVFASSDGGSTWTAQTPPGGVRGLTAVTFPDANNGWAVSYDGSIIHTSNGGASWATQTAPGARSLHGVAFAAADTQHGWAVGGAAPGPNSPDVGFVLHTVDGGATWTQQSLPASTHELDAVAAVSANQATAVGRGITDAGGCSNPSIDGTSNAGATWAEQFTQTCATTPAPPPPNTPAGAYTVVLGSGKIQNSTSQTQVFVFVNPGYAYVTIPAGALPVGTTVTIYAGNVQVLAPMVPPGQHYVTSFAVSWSAPDGSSPMATQPLTLTVHDTGISPASATYQATTTGLVPYPSKPSDSQADIVFANDPGFVFTSFNVPANVPDAGASAVVLVGLGLVGLGVVQRRRSRSVA